MNIYYDAVFWMFQPEMWVILGLVLTIADIFLGTYYILPVGIAALITGALIHVQEDGWMGETVVFETWQDIIIGFSVLAVLCVIVLRWMFYNRRKNTPDINDY